MAVKNYAGNNAGMPLGFNRGNPIPLDSSSIYATYEAAEEYAKNGAVAYVGQVIAVNYDEGAKAYIIADEAGTLTEIGAEVTQDGILTALGFNDAASGAQLVKSSDGTLAWVVPSTDTVEGLQTTVGTLQTAVNKLNADSTTEGSVAYQIAQIVAGADTNYDTLKEIADWISSDSTGATKMANDITALETKVGDDSVADQITAALKDGENDKYALASDLTTANDAIDALEELIGETSVSAQITAALQVDGQEKYALKSHTHAVADITGLQDLLNGKANTTVTDDLASRLEAIETAEATVADGITQENVNQWNAAEANIIETIRVNNTALSVANKIVDLPIATAEAYGLIKPDDSSIEVADGVLGVKAVHISKIYMDSDDELILDGGNA